MTLSSNAGNTSLPYWIESGVNTTTTSIWVKVDSISASPATTAIYMYYGNSSAVASSNGDNTFIFFNDFENGAADLAKFDISGATASIDSTQYDHGANSMKLIQTTGSI